MIDELYPAIVIARIMGVAPYKTDKFRIRLSPVAMCYSIIVNCMYMYILYNLFAQDVKVFSYGRFPIIPKLRTAGVCISLPMSFILSVLELWKMCTFVDRINKFDAMVNLRRMTKQRVAGVWSFVLTTTVLASSVTNTLEYIQNGIVDPGAFYLTVVYIGYRADINRYTIIVLGMLRRFQHIHRLIETGTYKNTSKIKVINTRNTSEFLRML